MRKIHYRNVGLPKTGTSWVWHQLMRHHSVDGKLQDHMKEFKGKSLEDYRKQYDKFDVSVNLDTQLFYDSYDDNHFASPKRIHEHTTHITLSLRNPYEILDSMFNMVSNLNPNHKDSKQAYTDLHSEVVKRYTDYTKIFDYWKSCKIDIKYMFYDDLVTDAKKYMFDICEYIGIKPLYNSKHGRALMTVKKDPLVFDNEETIKYINENISVIEDKLKRDLSHWKKQ